MTRTGHRTPLLLAAAGAWSVLLALPAAARPLRTRRERARRAGRAAGRRGRRARPERRRAARPRPRRAESARAGRRATAPRRRRSPAPRVAGAGRGSRPRWPRRTPWRCGRTGTRVVRDGGERAQRGIADRRPLAVEGLLEDVRHERRGAGGRGGGGEREREAPAPQVGAEPQSHQQRPLHPPRGDHHEDRGEPGVLEGRGGIDERAVEVEQRRDHRSQLEASRSTRLLVAVNGRASGMEDPQATARELQAVLEEAGAHAEAVVTESEEELWGCCGVRRPSAAAWCWPAGRDAARGRERAAAPAARAGARARRAGQQHRPRAGHPGSRAAALSLAATGAARPLDALRVATPDRFVYVLEALSAGFQAEARSGYRADNSSDLRQGVRALLGALRRFRPYATALRLDDGELSSRSSAQILLSNLPYFGFGFEVNPGADPADGHFEAIVFEADSRRRLVRLLMAARRGRHLGRPGVRRVAATRARLAEAPLVADALPLGTTTATVTVEPPACAWQPPALERRTRARQPPSGRIPARASPSPLPVLARRDRRRGRPRPDHHLPAGAARADRGRPSPDRRGDDGQRDRRLRRADRGRALV